MIAHSTFIVDIGIDLEMEVRISYAISQLCNIASFHC